MEKIDGEYYNYLFSEYAKDLTIKTLTNIKINGLFCGNYNYTGMVNKNNYPHGFGRAIRTDNFSFFDGQFKDGKLNGYIRYMD